MFGQKVDPTRDEPDGADAGMVTWASGEANPSVAGPVVEGSARGGPASDEVADGAVEGDGDRSIRRR